MEIPVYLFTGFLDSGKTKFIQETLEDVNFNNGEKILLVVCEEGEEEYNEDNFPGDNVDVVYIEEKEELTKENLTAISKKSGAERVLIEYNGMWMLDELYAALPDEWLVYQEMMFADASSFESYNANMRSLVGDKLKSCEMCVFNRAKADFDKMAIHKIVRSVSRRAQIAYEYLTGEVEYDDIEDPLPFDKNAPVIEIEDDDYGLWYMDFAENTSDYIGKTIKIRALTMRNKLINAKSEIIVGRQIMTCCADDITYKGLLCKAQNAHDFA
ncbi:MAG: GTPase, partial [Clostridia bacterium]|nr:GTPase [Clostridia bacterium]